MLSLIKSILSSASLLTPARKVCRPALRLKLRFQYSYTHPYTYEVSIYGEKICFSIKDSYSLGWFLPRYRREIHEPRTTALFSRLCQDEGDVLDVGANLGWFTCVAGAISGATVHAFELDEENFQRLRTNVSLNDLRNVRTIHTAVTSSPGCVSYWKEPGTASPVLSLGSGREENRKSVEVEAITLDDYVENNCQSVGVIKIDVEGEELGVLEGGSETVDNFHPHILLEVHPSHASENSQVSVEEALHLLPDSYKIYHVEEFRGNSEELMGDPIDAATFDPDGTAMLYAEPPEKPLSKYPIFADKLYKLF